MIKSVLVLFAVLSASSARDVPKRRIKDLSNNLCIDQRTLDEPMMGAPTPIENPGEYLGTDGTGIRGLMGRGTWSYINNPSLQDARSKHILETCEFGVNNGYGGQDNIKALRDSEKALAACINSSTGMPEYTIQSQFTVPCSKENIAKLSGDDRVITITTEAIVREMWAAKEGVQESIIEKVYASDPNGDYTKV